MNLQGKKDNSRSLLTGELHIRHGKYSALFGMEEATARIVGPVVILIH